MRGIGLRADYDAASVRRAAGQASDPHQVRRLLAVAAVYDGLSRAAAAKLGGMDRQTLRDWVHRFNEAGPCGLLDRKAPGARRNLSAEQEAELAALVEAGPNFETDGVVCWRCVDLRDLIRERWGVDYHERTIGKLLKRLGFSHITARPRHHGQDPDALETFKKRPSQSAWQRL